jgi:hypothetical protein
MDYLFLFVRQIISMKTIKRKKIVLLKKTGVSSTKDVDKMVKKI